MDFKFQVMEMSLIKHKFERSQTVAITASEFERACTAEIPPIPPPPLRGDSTRPLNIYGTTEIQMAVSDFLSSSLPLLAVFRGFFLYMKQLCTNDIAYLNAETKKRILELCFYLHK